MAQETKQWRKLVTLLALTLMVGAFAGGFFLGKSKKTNPATPASAVVDSLRQVIQQREEVLVTTRKSLDSATAAVDALLFEIVERDEALLYLRHQYARQNHISSDARELERLFAERYGADSR